MDWEKQNKRLTKTFIFKNQTQLAEFLLKIALHSDQLGHHPDVTVFQCSKMKIELFTHDQQKITELDNTLAEYIDSLL